MSHKLDFFERIRHFILPKVGVVSQFLEDITGYSMNAEGVAVEESYVGYVGKNEEEFEKDLHDVGFERNPLASWKSIFNDRKEHEEGSFRWIPNTDGDYDPSFQLHVILFDGSRSQNVETGHILIFAHWELRWDKYPIKHFRGIGLDYETGVKLMKQKMERSDIEYNDEFPKNLSSSEINTLLL